MIYLGLFESYQKSEMQDSRLVLHNAVFGRLFGPWVKGHLANKIIIDLTTLSIIEHDINDQPIKTQNIRLVTRNDKLKEVIEWMDNPTMDHLYTEDGKKVFRFYSGTNVERNLRELYDEVKLELREAPNEAASGL